MWLAKGPPAHDRQCEDRVPGLPSSKPCCYTQAPQTSSAPRFKGHLLLEVPEPEMHLGPGIGQAGDPHSVLLAWHATLERK